MKMDISSPFVWKSSFSCDEILILYNLATRPVYNKEERSLLELSYEGRVQNSLSFKENQMPFVTTARSCEQVFGLQKEGIECIFLWGLVQIADFLDKVLENVIPNNVLTGCCLCQSSLSSSILPLS